MKRLLVPGVLSAALFAIPCAAQTEFAHTSRDAHLRAGPARQYPVVAILPAGLPILVQGCLSDYTWCDVAAGPSRGWVYAGSLDYAYEGTYVPVLGYGSRIGIGVSGFILLDYWSEHYHDRPWYRERDRWDHDRQGWNAGPQRASPQPAGAIGRPQHSSEQDRPVAAHSRPPQQARPDAQRQPPRQESRPGAPHPQAPRPEQPDTPRSRPQQPQPDRAGPPRAQSPQQGRPEAQRPQPAQRDRPGGQSPPERNSGGQGPERNPRTN